MPDSPIRLKWQYQLYARLARPTLDWVGVVGAAWALFVVAMASAIERGAIKPVPDVPAAVREAPLCGEKRAA